MSEDDCPSCLMVVDAECCSLCNAAVCDEADFFGSMCGVELDWLGAEQCGHIFLLCCNSLV